MEAPPGVDLVLRRARAGLRRLHPEDAWRIARTPGAFVVDTRPQFQRQADGDIPGAIVIERNHLEWRLDPAGQARIPEATSPDITWIVLCDEGYSSSLAAASLHEMGLSAATDVIGGFRAWAAAGLPRILGQVAAPRLAPGTHLGRADQESRT